MLNPQYIVINFELNLYQPLNVVNILIFMLRSYIQILPDMLSKTVIKPSLRYRFKFLYVIHFFLGI